MTTASPTPKRTRAILFLALGLILIVLAIVGYFLFVSPVCTVMGCLDKLEISLAGEVPQQFTMQILASDGTSRQVECLDGGSITESANDVTCLPGLVIFHGFIPDKATLTITWAGGQVVEQIQPVYEAFRPNGPNCPPECQTAQVQITLP